MRTPSPLLRSRRAPPGGCAPRACPGSASYLPHKALCAGLAAAARIDHSEKHRSPTRNTPQARAFRGTDAKEFPILSGTDHDFFAAHETEHHFRTATVFLAV